MIYTRAIESYGTTITPPEARDLTEMDSSVIRFEISDASLSRYTAKNVQRPFFLCYEHFISPVLSTDLVILHQDPRQTTGFKGGVGLLGFDRLGSNNVKSPVPDRHNIRS